jgi:hypothetical protein
MASSVALRNHLHAIVLRGVQRLRWIEMASEAAEELLLEARMVVAASLDEGFDDEWAPSPEEIAAARDEIYAGWSDEERERRRRHEYVSTQMKRYVADFNYQRANEGPPPETGPSARQRRYREQHRQRIRARQQDPAYKEKQREWNQRYRERKQFLIKEKIHSKAEQYNANRRAARAVRLEEINERRRQHYAENREAILEQIRELRVVNRDEFNARRRARAAERRAAACC